MLKLPRSELFKGNNSHWHQSPSEPSPSLQSFCFDLNQPTMCPSSLKAGPIGLNPACHRKSQTHYLDRIIIYEDTCNWRPRMSLSKNHPPLTVSASENISISTHDSDLRQSRGFKYHLCANNSKYTPHLPPLPWAWHLLYRLYVSTPKSMF